MKKILFRCSSKKDSNTIKEKALQKQVKRFVKKITKQRFPVLLGNNFAFIANEEPIITYGLFLDPVAALSFSNFVSQLAPSMPYFYDIFLWSLLHEIGHYFTFDIDDYDNYLSLRQGLEKKVNDLDELEIENKVNIYNQYYSLPDEFAATSWAIDFVKNNQDFCIKWDKRFKKELKNIMSKFDLD